MSPSDDRSHEPWTDPQTHLDTDPVNAEPTRQSSDEPAHPAEPDASGPDSPQRGADEPVEDES
ncbi:hypothetical protein [Nocardioides sp. zg-1228]|uniref:hypothetical protein n=1 Tax=Nocardioides sp. zg-1228 TaxID=2763008 RepID=UPI0016427FEC|nr:hypothetical protein [Nocardioides sp. zg-1228]MBC2932532.1 hypothetical protein [Nocardioides sp. zg-1228]QSF58031.1 hypothetical protein JX575_02045 [Nocardioides sp. zg-1228]